MFKKTLDTKFRRLALVALIFVIMGFSYASATDNIGQFENNRLIVLIATDTPELITGKTIGDIATTGILSIDAACGKIGVTQIEQFYPGRLTKPALIELVKRMYIFSLDGKTTPQDAAILLSKDPAIEIAEPIAIPQLCYQPNDPSIGMQWHLGQIHAFDAWETVRGDTTRHSVIAILDTGIEWDHPDLAANIWINAVEDINHNGLFDPPDNNGVDDDSNGFIDDVVGWDWGDGDNDPTDNGIIHGTPVAGVASEVTDNGTMGAAIGFSARLMSVSVINSAGYLANFLQGMIYAVENGADILNCSWGTPVYSAAEQGIITALWESGALIIGATAASGNDQFFYPAAYDHVIAVAATDRNDHKTYFSSYGTWIDLCAPGMDIFTTYTGGAYTSYSGTSFAASMVSGLAALIWAWRPELTNAQVENLLKESADSIDYLNPGYAGLLGAGRINASAWLTTSINPSPILPEKIVLDCYPNPFNGQVKIRIDVQRRSVVSLGIYDILGHHVTNLLNSSKAPGQYEITWEAKDISSGIYFYKLTMDGFQQTRKMLLLK